MIGQGEVAAFLQDRLGRDAWRTRLAPASARRLFNWPTLNRALAEHRLVPPRLRLERAGGDVTRGVFRERRTRRGALLQDLDAGILNARLQDGATLILDAANEISPALQELCAGLAAEFACSCQANLYACWGTTQGFDVHWDDHDVFVVQVEGRKRWALSGVTRPSPTREDAVDPGEPPSEPLEEVVLEPGDVLYLPRGYWHAAVGLGGPTMHLTVGLTRKTGGDFLHWLADEALAAAPMRADLPLEQDDTVLAARLADILSDLAARDPYALAAAYRRRVESTQTFRPALSFPFIGGEAEALEETKTVSLAPGAARLESRGQSVVLTWRGIAYTVAVDVERPLAKLMAGEALTVAAFTAATAEASRPRVAEFISDMAGRGVFQLRDEGS